MKKFFSGIMAIAMLLSMAACGTPKAPSGSAPAASGSTASSQAAESKPAKPIKVAVAIAGTLGDKGFNDIAHAGVKRAQADFGIEYKVVEMTSDKTKYEPTLMDLSESGEYDIISCAGFAMKEIVQRVAPQFPDQKYFLYDANLDTDKGSYPNVYANMFKQNEASFLAGIVAANMTSADLPDMNKDKNVGCIAMMDMSVINDFLVGYIDGVQYADKDVKVNSAYIGAVDAAKAKDMAAAQFQQKTDVVFQVAASAGLGVIESAKENKGYVIGVDQDQAMLFMESDPEAANRIITSVMKRVDEAIYRVVKMYVADPNSVPWGTWESLGIQDGCVGIAKTDVYQKLVPDAVKQAVEDAEKKITSGELQVKTAFGMDADTLTSLRNSVKP